MHYFEGVEKRVIATFSVDPARPLGLRALSTEDWKGWCRHARCSILSRTSNEHFDAFVLSESSLFVYPSHIIAKTCGSTTLLHAVEPLIDLAKSVGCEPEGMCFTRMNYNFPQGQVYPHTSFEEEVEYLDETFVGKPYILGPLDAERYHMYLADSADEHDSDKRTLEVQMFELDPETMANFFRGPDGLDGETQTRLSGIDTILPGSTIDAFAFDPCGYSMNGLLGAAYWTIHITPEDHCSYVSFETNLDLADYSELLARVTRVFKPKRVCVSLLSRRDALKGRPSSEITIEGFSADHMSNSLAASNHALSYAAFAKDSLEASIKRSESGKNVLRKQAEMPAVKNRVSGRQQSQANLLLGSSLSGSLSNSQRPQSPGAASNHSGNDSVMAVPATPSIKCVPSTCSREAVLTEIKDRIATSDADSFFVVDLDQVTRQYRRWMDELPMVVPHYAVKCNPDPTIVRHLRDLGASFDCASEAEMNLVLSMGVSPSKIVYANPTRPVSHLRFARAHNVDVLTADNTDELLKIASEHPTCRVLIRIAPLETDAICPLGAKFGATERSVTAMLEVAKAHRVDIAGVAFHVGSGTRSLTSYAATILRAKAVFNECIAAGFRPRILDIGGGMPGKDGVDSPLNFSDIAATIRPLLKEHFDSASVKVISEPGRFFVADSHTLVARIVARRDCTAEVAFEDAKARPETFHSDSEVSDTSGTSTSLLSSRAFAPRFLYYVADGVYGSFNCLLFDHATVKALPLKANGEVLSLEGICEDANAICTVFGPTCDALDCILERTYLPKMEIGDFLYFETLGAYTSASSTEFNGFSRPNVHFINSAKC
jgi:ornithine decarboxylase